MSIVHTIRIYVSSENMHSTKGQVLQRARAEPMHFSLFLALTPGTSLTFAMIKAFLTKAIFVGLLVAANGNEGDSPVVRIKTGSVRGFLQKSTKGYDIYSFMSIPFAAPPVGQLRFKPPKPAQGWSHTLDGTAQIPFCIQHNTMGSGEIIGQEDCLYLNVFSRKLPESDGPNLPVMVWIHGGGFAAGTASSLIYSPKVLLNKEIVMVAMNYRLGSMGFLSTGDKVIQGNMGLKDQSMALRWVKENIEAFGGDPDRVTIVGESAGSASVHFHQLSPMSRGLFHQAIQQSGSALGHWAFFEPDEITLRSKRIAAMVDCPIDSSEIILQCLQAANARDIVGAVPLLYEWYIFPVVYLAATRETAGDERFLERSPREIMEAGEMTDVPLMTGICESEGDFFVGGMWKEKLLQQVNDEYLNLFPLMLGYNYLVNEPDKFSKRVRNFYFHDEGISEKTLPEFVRMISDNFIVWRTFDGVQRRLTSNAKSPTFFYLFTYFGPVSASQGEGYLGGGSNYKPHGATHVDDLFYLFQFPPMTSFEEGSPEERMSDLMTSWWTSFIINGTPNSGSGQESDVPWHPVEKHAFNVFNMSLTPQMTTEFIYERMSFCKNLQHDLDASILKAKDEL